MDRMGISLPWDYISDSTYTKEAAVIQTAMGPQEIFLKQLKDEGVVSIELRHRHKGLTFDEMYQAVDRIAAAGFSFTIHGEALPKPEEFSFTKLFSWYKIVNKIITTDTHAVVVTFHPLIVDNERDRSAELTSTVLRSIVESTQLPSYTYALENQRSKGYIDPAVTFDGVVRMVAEVPDKQVGICWDMGHSYSNVVHYNHPVFPPKEFLERVIHTHIHDLGPSGRTHWPFKENKVPLEKNVRLLQSYNYKGIYNMELSFDRFAHEASIKQLVLKSLRTLRKLLK